MLAFQDRTASIPARGNLEGRVATSVVAEKNRFSTFGDKMERRSPALTPPATDWQPCPAQCSGKLGIFHLCSTGESANTIPPVYS